MNGPGRDGTDRGLYTAEDYSRAADTIRRIGNCHEYRLASEISARPGRAVAAARLAIDLVETATIAELRAMVVQLTTPELRPPLPVAFGPTSVPAGSDIQPVEEGVGGLATPTPPAGQAFMKACDCTWCRHHGYYPGQPLTAEGIPVDDGGRGDGL